MYIVHSYFFIFFPKYINAIFLVAIMLVAMNMISGLGAA